MQRRPETACEQQAAAVMAQLVSAAVGPSSPVAEGEANANDRPKSNRQRYVSVACDFCKRRHARCDAVQPRCSLCNRFNEECTYEIEMRKKGRKKRSMEENGPDLMQSSPSSPASVHHVPPQAATVVAEGPVPAATSPTDVGARAQPLGMALVHSLGQQVTTFDRQSLTEVHTWHVLIFYFFDPCCSLWTPSLGVTSLSFCLVSNSKAPMSHGTSSIFEITNLCCLAILLGIVY